MAFMYTKLSEMQWTLPELETLQPPVYIRKLIKFEEISIKLGGTLNVCRP